MRLKPERMIGKDLFLVPKKDKSDLYKTEVACQACNMNQSLSQKMNLQTILKKELLRALKI